MARRIALQDPDAAIRCLKEDGGVILTNFSSIGDVIQVNNDAAPFINEIVAEVRYDISSSLVWSFAKAKMTEGLGIAISQVPPSRDNQVHAPIRPEYHSS